MLSSLRSLSVPQPGKIVLHFQRRNDMAEVSAEIMRQLEQAQANLAQNSEKAGSPLAAEGAVPEAAAARSSGNGVANYVLLDYYFTNSVRQLWTYSNGAWRYQDVPNIGEKDLVQIAFMSDKVECSWDHDNKLTFLRCSKNF